ncbi:MAG: hypothetical protein NMK33_01225 [Candidatus Cardinium sp.]|nr:MAG: hypothetical protein NMK33_01225 [Candidatus Cardinium sp.]
MITKEQILEKVGGEEYLIRHLVPTFNSNVRKKITNLYFPRKMIDQVCLFIRKKGQVR